MPEWARGDWHDEEDVSAFEWPPFDDKEGWNLYGVADLVALATTFAKCQLCSSLTVWATVGGSNAEFCRSCEAYFDRATDQFRPVGAKPWNIWLRPWGPRGREADDGTA